MMMTAIPVISAPQLKAPETTGSNTNLAIKKSAETAATKPVKDTFNPKKNQTNLAKPKPSSQLGDEKQWFINGTILTGATSFVIASVCLWVTIGTKRFIRWEGLHANIPMATVGGLVAGGALGVLSCRFINSIKNRLNGTVEETPEVIVNLPVNSKA
ncbi:MAG: hypothetical protein H2174_03270 [Vampirovibrio sp.]|nr:hypothetical protein [Vampirovibrio sp.]